MSVNRMNRIDSELQRALSYTISYELKNPVFENTIISVTKVSTTPDLKYSKVFLSIFPDSKVQDVFNEIRNCIPFIRKTIARKINLRTCPEFHFEIDDSLAYSKKMDDLFAKISKDGNNND